MGRKGQFVRLGLSVTNLSYISLIAGNGITKGTTQLKGENKKR